MGGVSNHGYQRVVTTQWEWPVSVATGGVWSVSIVTVLLHKHIPQCVQMDSESLSLNFEYVSSSGVVLSVEKRASLLTSLTLVQQSYKFHRVKFWGIIRGIQNDYYIIQGIGKDEIRGRKGLYRYACLWTLCDT